MQLDFLAQPHRAQTTGRASAKFFRISPAVAREADPLPVPELIPRGTGITEESLHPGLEVALDELEQANRDRHPGIETPGKPSTPLDLTGSECLVHGDRCLGDNRDTAYYRNILARPLADDDTILVFGVNHEATDSPPLLVERTYADPETGIGPGLVSPQEILVYAGGRVTTATATEGPVLPVYRHAIYNPGRLTDAEVKATFIARQALFHELMDDIRASRPGSRPQHHLVVGQRGMGKTILLRRLDVSLREDPNLATFVPLSFPEEQWTIDRLSKLWLNCLDSLADTLEKEDQASPVIDAIDSAVDVLRRDPMSEDLLSEEAEREFLRQAEEIRRRPVLLIDNLDMVFNRLESHEQKRLRSSLMASGAPILIGACVSPPAQATDYSAPFYDHFKTHYLERLSPEEMQEVLRQLAEQAGQPAELLRQIDRERPRLFTLHALTGGNPRTTAILFQILCQGFSKEAYQDLEALLDWVTPLYKARFEELAPQAQMIVSTLATHWEPMAAGQVGTATRLENRQVSPQLNRLRKAGIVEVVPIDPEDRVGQLTSGKRSGRNGYQLAERFFNIWFLMRQSTRRDRRNLIYLTRFIECVHTPGERAAMARARLGWLYQSELDRFPDAEQAYLKAIELDSENLDAWNGLGLLLADHLGRAEEAESAFRKAIAADPEEPMAAQNNLVSVLRDQLGRLPEAAELARELSFPEASTRDSGIALHPALFAAYQDNWSEARDHLATALDLIADRGAFPQDTFPGWMRATAVLIHLDYGERLLDFLHDRGDDQRLRPWYEAIRAQLRGDRQYLRNIPVEMRDVAGRLFDHIHNLLEVLPDATRRWSPHRKQRAKGRKRRSRR